MIFVSLIVDTDLGKCVKIWGKCIQIPSLQFTAFTFELAHLIILITPFKRKFFGTKSHGFAPSNFSVFGFGIGTILKPKLTPKTEKYFGIY